MTASIPPAARVHLHVGHAHHGRDAQGSALQYEAVAGQVQWQRLIGGGPVTSLQSTALVMVETASHRQSVAMCAAIVDRVIPGLWTAIEHIGAAQTLLEEIIAGGHDSAQVSVAAIRWPHCLLLSHGGQRAAIVRKHTSRILEAGTRDRMRVLADTLHPGDRVVLVAEATGAALPMPAIGLASKRTHSAGTLAREMVVQAGLFDPSGPHAVLAMLVGTDQP